MITPRQRKPHKRPNRDRSTIPIDNIKTAWATDTNPGHPKQAIGMRLAPEVLDWYQARAAATGIERSVIMRIALDQYRMIASDPNLTAEIANLLDCPP